MRIDLRHNRMRYCSIHQYRYVLCSQGKRTIEIEVERLNWDINPERTVLELAAPIPRNNVALLGLLHQRYRVQNARDRGGSKESAPDDSIRGGDVVQQLGGPVTDELSYDSDSTGDMAWATRTNDVPRE